MAVMTTESTLLEHEALYAPTQTGWRNWAVMPMRHPNLAGATGAGKVLRAVEPEKTSDGDATYEFDLF